MVKYEVIGLNYGLIMREYKNKYSAYNYAKRIKIPCYVRQFDSTNGKYTDLRFYI